MLMRLNTHDEVMMMYWSRIMFSPKLDAVLDIGCAYQCCSIIHMCIHFCDLCDLQKESGVGICVRLIEYFTTFSHCAYTIICVCICHGCFISIEPVTKRLRLLIRNFFIATDLITTLATNMGLKMLLFYHEGLFLTLLYTSDPTSIFSGALNDVS